MKNFVQQWLTNLARQILAKHKPKVIGITGSVGKTSTRDAIYAVVSTAFSVRKGNKNYNNEFGLPFAILGIDEPGRNVLKWSAIFLKSYYTLWLGSFPQVLILEMGVDKPGDMDYLLSIARPDIAVITNIGISHFEFFKSTEAVATEKGKLVQALSESGVAILNADNPVALNQANKTSAKVISYGFAENADVRIRVLSENFSVPVNSQVEVVTHYNNFEAKVPAIGVPHISSCAAAVAVGLNLNIGAEQLAKGLGNYKSTAGRLNFLSGIKKSLIIDDTYNASPDSVKQALAVIGRAPQQKKIIALGDMLELGDLADTSHQDIGKLVAQIKPDLIVAVGSLAKIMLESAVAAGFPKDQTMWFQTSDQALDSIRQRIISESVILVKGSQGARMEKISKELLADPMSASNVLPRQYGKWLVN